MFSSKKTIRDHFRLLRDKYLDHLGEPITDPADISDLVQLADYKFCSLDGMSYFTVMKNHYRTVGFRVYFHDGHYQTLGFSITKPHPVLDAMRYAISDDIWEIKLKHPNKEIHHILQFSQIAAEFFKIHPKSDIKAHHRYNGGYKLSNPELEKEWIKFHRLHAQLEPLSYKEHKAQHKRSNND